MTQKLFLYRIWYTAALAALLLNLTSCAADGMSDGTKRGARSGALVGLTLGALTGDASLAAAGVVAGGVVGGAAGNMKDYEMDRQDYRTDTLATAIATKDSGGQGEAPPSWDNIDSFVGEWNVNMWWTDASGTRVDATANAKSSLNTTQSVTFNFSNFRSDSFSESITGSTTISFQQDRGFELLNHFSTSPEGNYFVGHFDNPANKYEFFYAGSDQATFTGVRRGDYRLEMQMIGRDVMVMETWAAVGNDEKRIQSYRLTREN